MLLELIFALTLGILIGIFTGLFPSLHINLVASIVSGFVIVSREEIRLGAIVFIVALSITHTFLDFIPSIFLGAPEEDSFLAAMPGHEMLLEGRGVEAVYYALIGAFVGIMGFLVLTPGLNYFVPLLFEGVRKYFFVVLIFISFYLVLREKKVLSGLVIFVFSGILGYLSFNLNIEEPLLPLLSGLFGVSSLIVSLNYDTKIPKQIIMGIGEIGKDRGLVFNSFFSLMICPFFCFLPGIGAGHAATFISEIRNLSRKGFIFVNGIAASFIMASSFFVVYLIGKARTGSAAFVIELGEMSYDIMLIIFIAIFISSIVSLFLGIFLVKKFSRLFERVNYRNLSLFVIFVILFVNLIFSKWIGLIVLTAGSCLGVMCSLLEVRKINLMGALILSSILYYIIP